MIAGYDKTSSTGFSIRITYRVTTDTATGETTTEVIDSVAVTVCGPHDTQPPDEVPTKTEYPDDEAGDQPMTGSAGRNQVRSCHHADRQRPRQLAGTYG